MTFTERSIGAWLVRNTFQRKLLVVPNCTWTGHECDLLAVTENLRLVDIEIKISRADLRADRDKDKWWDRGFGRFVDGKWVTPPPTARRWPRSIWKHYYCLPAAIWKDDMLDTIAKTSGVLLVTESQGWGASGWGIASHRRATPNRDAKPIDTEDAINLARLAGLRMWDALAAVDRMADDRKRELDVLAGRL